MQESLIKVTFILRLLSCSINKGIPPETMKKLLHYCPLFLFYKLFFLSN